MGRGSRAGAFRLGLAVLGLALGLVAVWACALTASASPDGSAAPSFAGNTLDGDAVSLESYHGRPLVLLFWGSW